jgi:hypothetical protein
MLSPEVGFRWWTPCTLHLEGALVVDRYNDSSVTVEDALWYIAIQIGSMISVHAILHSKDPQLLKRIEIEAL